jgi:hypothetical protein
MVQLANADSLEGVAAYMEYAVRVLFEMMRRGRHNTEWCPSEARVNLSISHEYMLTDSFNGFVLGYDDKSVLNAHAVLGTSTSEAVPRLDMAIEISLIEWKMLNEQPAFLVFLAKACDLAVPLNCNYRVYFRVHPDDWIFRLPERSRLDERADACSILGVNSALGSA